MSENVGQDPRFIDRSRNDLSGGRELIIRKESGPITCENDILRCLLYIYIQGCVFFH